MSSGILKKEVNVEENKDNKKAKNTEYNPIAKLFSKFYGRSFLPGETYYDVSNLVIKFLSLTSQKPPIDFYDDRSKISFKDIDPVFQKILKQEFSGAMEDFGKYFKH